MVSEKIKMEIDDLFSYTYKQMYVEEKLDEYKQRFEKLINPYVDRLNMNKKVFVHALSVENAVVNRMLSKHCIYMDGNYIGKIYIDKSGNIFDSIVEVKDLYGDDAILCVQNNACTYHAEAVYVPELDCILYGRIGSSCYANATHVDDNNSFVNYIYLDEPKYFLITKDLNTLSPASTPSNLRNSYANTDCKVHGLDEAIKQMYGVKFSIVNIGGNRYVTLDSIPNYIAFVSYKAKLEHKKGKIQNKIDELVEMKKFDNVPIADRMPHEYNNLICKTHINKISDKICVIRWTYNYKDDCFDGMRVYIDGNDVYACKSNNNGEFVRVSLSTLNQKNFTAEYNSEIAIDDMSGTRLEWYASVINKIPEKHRITMLMMFLNDLKIEQLVKLGFCDAICNKIEESTINVSTAIRIAMQVNDNAENGKNIHKWIGVNKHQLNKILEFSAKYDGSKDLFRIIYDMKSLLNNRDISSYDNTLFDNMINSYVEYYTEKRNYWQTIHPQQVQLFISKLDDDEVSESFKNNMLRYIPSLLNMTNWNKNQVNMYTDYYRMVMQMGIKNRVKMYLDSYDEVVEHHNLVMSAYNAQKDHYYRGSFDHRMNILKKMEYSAEDSAFMVVVPKAPEDLAVEGLELRHCVKSYIERVCQGHTNILFIRKKDEVDKPFFTVELTNDNIIAQVHGFANRNASTEPGMVEFVHRWARNKRLRIGAFDSIRG